MSPKPATRSNSKSSTVEQHHTKDLEEDGMSLKRENEILRTENARLRSREAEHVLRSKALAEDMKGLNYKLQQVLDDYT